VPESDTKVTASDVMVALTELHIAGLVEFEPGSEELFHITNKGIEHGKAFLERFSVKERLLLVLTKDELIDDSMEHEDPI
jgi:Mn-dependent DtxR family transcriptional regulator